MSKAQRIHKSGFFLLELLISMVIMMIVWLLIAHYQNSVIQTTYIIQQRIKALNLATHLLDSNQLSNKHKKIDGFMVTWNMYNRTLIIPEIFSSNISNSQQFKLITVHVAWDHNGHTQSVDLTSGMVTAKEQL